jgi:hypothetical protein
MNGVKGLAALGGAYLAGGLIDVAHGQKRLDVERVLIKHSRHVVWIHGCLNQSIYRVSVRGGNKRQLQGVAVLCSKSSA